LQSHRNYPLASEFIDRTAATGEKRLEFERQLLVRYSMHLRGCIITIITIIIIINFDITGWRDIVEGLGRTVGVSVLNLGTEYGYPD